MQAPSGISLPDDKPPPPTPLSKPIIFATSGMGGVMGWCIVHPFNTLAVRINLASMNPGAAPKPFVAYASELIATEGVGSLYAGLGAGCLRQIFYATSRYGLFETFRDTAAKYRETDFAQRFTLASVAGGCAAFISCPVEVCLVRMSNDAAQPAAEQRGYKSVFDAFGRIMGEEGFGAFYRGSQPFVMRAMLVGGTQVATYDQFKTFYQKQIGAKASAILAQFCAQFRAQFCAIIPTRHLPRRQGGHAAQHLLLGDERRADLQRDHDAVRDDEEPHGVPEARRRGQAAVHVDAADDCDDRAHRGHARAVERLPPVLRPLRRPHRHHVLLRRRDPQDLPTIPRLSARRQAGGGSVLGRGGGCVLIVITCSTLSSQAGRRPFSISK